MDINDIAHHLSNICRFTGAVREFYSVAQHSVLVSHLCEKHPLAGLLHDASEAYLCDISTPVKQSDLFIEYREAEKYLQSMIYLHFGLRSVAGPAYDEVKVCDMAMATLEALEFMPPAPGAFWDGRQKMSSSLRAWSPAESKRRFLERFDELKRK